MVRKILYTVSILMVWAACTTAEKETETETPPPPMERAIVYDSTGIAIDSVDIPVMEDRLPVGLTCRKISPPDADNPLYEVSLFALNTNIPLDTIHSCSFFNNEAYAEIEIPSDAISACGGWYKGIGEYFYLKDENSDLVVYSVWLKEEQTTNRYPYREVYRLKLPALEQ